MTCKKTRINHKQYCTGDLNKLVIFSTRSLTANNDNLIDPSETFTNNQNVWVAIQSIKGIEFFDNSNIRIGVATIKVIARYDVNLFDKKTITYNNKYFKVIEVQNVDLNNEWMEFMCEERGDISNKVNQA